ncbi:unnamed protein product [Zymoseptoria tritici ST99CH_1E4]|uniref:Uncharacterized protein n=1 Tax=Zymoseptoria tritici ST99CH_1E4 TaxID=1276532 RepID=A0A2H1G5L5_ZYMTR|nr:unnamed protein product [Zymoseptoria tritici ST99CH_1E4]
MTVLQSDQASFIMSLLTDTRAILLLLVVLPLLIISYQVISDPLRSIPGPLLARFTRLWELYQVIKGDFEKTNIRLHRKYGPVVRLAPGRYSVNDESALKVIYGLGSGFTKSSFYTAAQDVDQHRINLFAERDPQVHLTARRKVASLYSMSNLLSYEPFVDQMNDLLCSKLTLHVEKGSPVNIPTWMQYYAFDVIGEMTIGKAFGMMERGHDSMDILDAIDGGIRHASRFGLFPELHAPTIRAMKRLGVSSDMQGLTAFIGARIQERAVGKTESNREDFLTKTMKLIDMGSIDLSNQFGVIGANIAAGSDTTAVSLSAVIYYLLRDPACAQKLRNEIDSFDREGKLSARATFKETQDMPYLQAVIKEALRMHPATGQVLDRVVPPGGSQICGYFFPAGTCVGANAWTVHRNQGIWGLDADKFRPERWLESSKEDLSRMNEGYMPFGLGSRTCIGKNISLLEMSKVITQLYRRFEFDFPDPAAPTDWKTNNVFFVKQSFACRVSPRV